MDNICQADQELMVKIIHNIHLGILLFFLIILTSLKTISTTKFKLMHYHHTILLGMVSKYILPKHGIYLQRNQLELVRLIYISYISNMEVFFINMISSIWPKIHHHYQSHLHNHHISSIQEVLFSRNKSTTQLNFIHLLIFIFHNPQNITPQVVQFFY